MSEPKIVASAKDKKKAKPVDAIQVWAALGWTALAFLIVGGADFALAWYPFDFGNREWEFGTATAVLNNMPILLLGIALFTASAVQIERRWWSYISATAALGLLLCILVALVLWATNVPLALRSVPIQLATGIKKSIAKTTVQGVVYPLILGFLFWRSLRATRGGASEG